MGEWKSLFDGNSLKGWKIYPRGIARLEEGSEAWENAWAHKGRWSMKEGVLEGRQDPPGCGLGSYLVSEETFGDFELSFDARPDWPADTGIYVRTGEDGCTGYQILLDHRKSGSIGGFYGNGIGGFHAINWNVDADLSEDGRPVRIKIEDPATTLEPITPDKPELLKYKITGEEFMRIWKWDDWNEFRIIVRGNFPVITTFINGEKIAEIDMNEVDEKHFDRVAAAKLGNSGHLSLEVHDNDPKMGKDRWGENAACRFRNMKIREIEGE